MEDTFTWVLREYVPGGCTALFQPCDVGMQRPIKHAIRQAQHDDVVREALLKISHNAVLKSKGQQAEVLKLDTTIGTLRDRSVGWLLKAYKQCNKPAIVSKVCWPTPLKIFNIKCNLLSGVRAVPR